MDHETDTAKPCPACEYRTSERFDYAAWLQAADRAIERGLNVNAIWRLHEKRLARREDCDLGGEG